MKRLKDTQASFLSWKENYLRQKKYHNIFGSVDYLLYLCLLSVY